MPWATVTIKQYTVYDDSLKPSKIIHWELGHWWETFRGLMYSTTRSLSNRKRHICIKLYYRGWKSEADILIHCDWNKGWNTECLQTIKKPQWQNTEGSNSSNISLCDPRWSLAVWQCILYDENGLDKPNSCWCKSLSPQEIFVRSCAYCWTNQPSMWNREGNVFKAKQTTEGITFEPS